MGYWGEVSNEAWRDTRAILRLDHPARIALTIGGVAATGGLTWWAISGIAWGAVATLVVLAVVGLSYFVIRLAQIPAERASAAQSLIDAMNPPRDDVARDMGLTEALCFAQTGELGLRPVNTDAGVFRDLTPELERFTQLAADGDLHVWGKSGRSDIYTLIPAAFWIENEVEWFSLLRGAPNTQGLIARGNMPTYLELMVSRGQIARHF